MNFESKIFKLKSGSDVKLRIATVSEAQKLLDLKRSYIKNTTSIPLTLDEYPNDLEHEMKLIEKYNKSQNSLLLVAEYNDDFIGNIDLTGSERSKMSHTGMIGMGVKEEWRNQGLGKSLIEAVINWARQNAELELLWLDVYASNMLGTNLYKNTGFRVSGVIEDFFKVEDGYADKIQMYQRV